MQPLALPAGLPEPDPASLEHSIAVTQFIAAEIERNGGAIPFGAFMQHALYAPGLGYYVAGNTRFGEGGDFVTAPEVSPLFGRVIARQIGPLIQAIENGAVLELGAGSGALAIELLSSLARNACEPAEYLILEVSPDLAARQRQAIEAAAPAFLDRVRWVDRVPSGFRGTMIANEVADALPVERFRLGTQCVEQAFVVIEAGRFAWDWRPALPAIAAGVADLRLAEIPELPEGYESTLSPGLGAWVTDLLGGLQQGLLLLFDYGLSRREYYAPDRSGGWLRCHFRHRVHSQPLVLPGIQDLSAWVDFTAAAAAGADAGATLAGYLTQGQFLIQGGLDREIAAASRLSEREQLALAGQARQLVMPDEMGEHFKCMAWTRGEVASPTAFAAMDRSGSL